MGRNGRLNCFSSNFDCTCQLSFVLSNVSDLKFIELHTYAWFNWKLKWATREWPDKEFECMDRKTITNKQIATDLQQEIWSRYITAHWNLFNDRFEQQIRKRWYIALNLHSLKRKSCLLRFEPSLAWNQRKLPTLAEIYWHGKANVKQFRMTQLSSTKRLTPDISL